MLLALCASCGHAPSSGATERALRRGAGPFSAQEGTGNEDAAPWGVTPGRVLPDVSPAAPRLVDVLPDGTRRFLVAGLRNSGPSRRFAQRAREVLPGGNSKVLSLAPVATWWGIAPRGRGRRRDANLARQGVDGATHAVRGVFSGARPVKSLPASTASTRGCPPAISIALEPRPAIRFRSGSCPPLRALARSLSRTPGVRWRWSMSRVMATFDAGVSWHRLPLEGQNVARLGLDEGDFVLETSGGRFVLGSGGELVTDPMPHTRAQGGGTESTPDDSPAYGSLQARALGRRPRRAALEDGWPLDPTAGDRSAPTQGAEPVATAVFAQEGSLYRVRLSDGAVLESRAGAFPEREARCHAIAVGLGFGFVCGSPLGPTVVYEHVSPFALRERLRFDHPRVVLSSGNGALVVRGGCAPAGAYAGAPDPSRTAALSATASWIARGTSARSSFRAPGSALPRPPSERPSLGPWRSRTAARSSSCRPWNEAACSSSSARGAPRAPFRSSSVAARPRCGARFGSTASRSASPACWGAGLA